MIEVDKENLQLERRRMREMIDELYSVIDDRPFTDWEYKFVCNMKNRKGELTQRQKDNLIRVYNKYFSKF